MQCSLRHYNSYLFCTKQATNILWQLQAVYLYIFLNVIYAKFIYLILMTSSKFYF